MAPERHVHGSKGVYCGGDWVDIEDVGGWSCHDGPSEIDTAATALERQEQRRNSDGSYDVILVGAGCIGAAIARELAKTDLAVLLLERDDDVTQGATKGNSGIVHAGYDDKPNTNRAKFCWKGNQMFAAMDRDLRFGFLRNGSLVVACSPEEESHLQVLYDRGQTNGIENLRIIGQAELRSMEPHISPNALAALYSPDAGTVTPYEYAIALAENAADNGVEIKTRHEVTGIDKLEGGGFVVRARDWNATPEEKAAGAGGVAGGSGSLLLLLSLALGAAACIVPALLGGSAASIAVAIGLALACGFVFSAAGGRAKGEFGTARVLKGAPHPTLAFQAGSEGKPVEFRAKHVINSAGLFSDKVARMVGDESFKIKPRLGDYLLLHKNQGHLARCTLFPCPDPKLGKGVLVQTTLWGNLILGPTARDIGDPAMLGMTKDQTAEYILSKCHKLVPSIDAGQTIHTFCGARAKSSRGDWIIEESEACEGFFHVAGIDSPGLAGSPAIALEVVAMLKGAGLKMGPNHSFNPVRRPLITPKDGWRGGLKVWKEDRPLPPDQNVICKCEKVTEAEIVSAVHRSLNVDNTQAVRRRTRAGMGHCQAGQHPFCEQRVAEIIARESGLGVGAVGRRPWPATSILPGRWIDDKQRDKLRAMAEQ